MAKSIRNPATGETRRVSDAEARQLTDQGWQYISKGDWKRARSAQEATRVAPRS